MDLMAAIFIYIITRICYFAFNFSDFFFTVVILETNLASLPKVKHSQSLSKERRKITLIYRIYKY